MTDTNGALRTRTPNARQRLAVIAVCSVLLLSGGALAAHASAAARKETRAVAGIRTDRPVDVPTSSAPVASTATASSTTTPAEVQPIPDSRPTPSAVSPRTLSGRDDEPDEEADAGDDEEHETVTPEVRDDDSHEDDASEDSEDAPDSH